MIIFQFDNAYHRWGLLALQSLQLHEPVTPVFCDTVNLSDHQITELQRAHERVTISNDSSTYSQTSPAQMAARKPFVFQNAMQRFPSHPLYGLFDADFLVRRPLQALWSLLDAHPAALFMTNGMWAGKYYRRLITPSGIVVVRPEAKRLIDCWAKWYHHDQPLEGIAPGAWFWDQITLAEAWTEAGIPCAMIRMDIYGDCQLSQSSTIWSAHVPQKDTYYELFRREYLRQREVISNRPSSG